MFLVVAGAARSAPAYAVSATGGTYVPLPSARLLDTRSGLGAPRAPLAPDQTINLAVTGHAGIPSTGVSAVAITITAINPTHDGYLTLYPDGSPRPTTSNLNYTAGQSIANLTIDKLGSNGTIDIHNAP
ncbi:MAG: hypothetical protein M3Y89_17430, partial [Actinomycetota bacterium]|nr:hypothetical protein [Actinomycetota bacterium]